MKGMLKVLSTGAPITKGGITCTTHVIRYTAKQGVTRILHFINGYWHYLSIQQWSVLLGNASSSISARHTIKEERGYDPEEVLGIKVVTYQKTNKSKNL